MSKSTKEPKNSTSAKKNPELLQVEKVVNQRFTNGKKQYKVIWIGKPFEQATWVEADQLNCNEKVEEFLARYQQVIKRKIQVIKNSEQNPPLSVLKVECLSKPETKKISLEKPENGTQQKIFLSQSSNLNKQKLQSSLQKNNINSQKKSQYPESFKPISNGIKPDGNNHKIQTQAEVVNLENSPSVKIIDKNDKRAEERQKIFEKKGKQEKDAKNSKSVSKTTEKIEFISQYEEDTAESEVQFPLELQQQTFIEFTERLEIQSIQGMILNLYPDDMKWKESSPNPLAETWKEFVPNFFLVKNRFQTQERLVSRERIINEQPLKLIEFYQTLFMEGERQSA